jgi:hypothetical protein
LIFLVDLNGERRVEVHSKAPPTFIVELPLSMENENAAWIDVIGGVPSINQATKNLILGQRQAQADADAAAAATRLQALKDLRQFCRDIRDTDVTNINQANTALKRLARTNLELLRLLILDSQ